MKPLQLASCSRLWCVPGDSKGLHGCNRYCLAQLIWVPLYGLERLLDHFKKGSIASPCSPMAPWHGSSYGGHIKTNAGFTTLLPLQAVLLCCVLACESSAKGGNVSSTRAHETAYLRHAGHV